MQGNQYDEGGMKVREQGKKRCCRKLRDRRGKRDEKMMGEGDDGYQCKKGYEGHEREKRMRG